MEHVRGLGAHDHVCWRYDRARDFRARAGEFLAEGLAQGHRVHYLASGSEESLIEDLRGVEGVERGLRTGAARVTSLEAAYPAGSVVEPEAQVRTYAEATEAALADGFTGLRVAADCTPLVRTPAQLEAFARYEHMVDHYVADQPFSAMCGYDAEVVDEPAFAQVACMHPTANDPSPGFRLHAAGGGAIVVGGEVDVATRDLFTQAVDRALMRPRAGGLMIDATELIFIDHNSLLHLERRAAESGAPIVLRTSWTGVTRQVELLGLTNIHVERAA